MGRRPVAEVFISYARDDRNLVAPIAARLKELGADVWFDVKIESGEPYEDVIEAELKKARAALVCWSKTAASSHWVRAEARLAQKLGIYVPVFVAECELPLALSEIQTNSLANWNGAVSNETWLKVVDRLSKKIDRRAIAAAAHAFAVGDEQTCTTSRGDIPTSRRRAASGRTQRPNTGKSLRAAWRRRGAPRPRARPPKPPTWMLASKRLYRHLRLGLQTNGAGQRSDPSRTL